MKNKKRRRILSLLNEPSPHLIAIVCMICAAPLSNAQKIRGMNFAHSLRAGKRHAV